MLLYVCREWAIMKTIFVLQRSHSSCGSHLHNLRLRDFVSYIITLCVMRYALVGWQPLDSYLLPLT